MLMLSQIPFSQGSLSFFILRWGRGGEEEDRIGKAEIMRHLMQ